MAIDDLPLFAHRPQRMHANSIEAYHEDRGKLSGRALAVLADVKARGPGTDREIAARMGYTHRSAVQPRISELVELGLLHETGRSLCRETMKRVRVVSAEAKT
jgi:predicted transcriptional regulator